MTDALSHITYPLGKSEHVNIEGGELLMVGPDENQHRSSFQFNDPMAFCGLGYGEWGYYLTYRNAQDDYTRALKSIAGAFGITPGRIDQLLAEGFTHEEIENCLYDI